MVKGAELVSQGWFTWETYASRQVSLEAGVAAGPILSAKSVDCQ